MRVKEMGRGKSPEFWIEGDSTAVRPVHVAVLGTLWALSGAVMGDVVSKVSLLWQGVVGVGSALHLSAVFLVVVSGQENTQDGDVMPLPQASHTFDFPSAS